MSRAHWILGATAAIGLTTGVAGAQERIEREIDAPKKSVEIGVGAGYTQGAGDAVAGERVSRLAGPGGEAQLDVGYRIDPRWLVGGYGSFGYFRTPDNAGPDVTVRGVTTGAQAQYHFMPMSRLDPWIGLGAGYRGIFSSGQDGPVTARHGIQIARVRVGLDYRVSTAVAMGPVLGFDATVFTGRTEPGQSEMNRITSENRTMTPFFFAGFAGRFDIVNQRVKGSERMVAAAF